MGRQPDTERVEGRNAVFELLSAGRPVSLVRIAKGFKSGDALDRIKRAAEEAGVPVELVPRHALDHDSEHGSHQGVMAYASPFAYVPIEQVLAASATDARSLILALDHVTDPVNLGAVVRTADAVSAAAVLVPATRSASMTPAAMKAAAGAAEHVAVCRETNLVRALDAAKASGYWVVGASEHAAGVVWDTELPQRAVIVLGSEGTGLARLTEKTCDMLVSVPTGGHVGSLNVSAAAAVLAFEWMRQGRAGEGDRG